MMMMMMLPPRLRGGSRGGENGEPSSETPPFYSPRKRGEGAALFLILLLTLLPSLASADEGYLHSGVGLSAGFASGNGFSYRSLPDSGTGWQGNFIYLRGSEMEFLNLGAEALFILNRAQSTTLYAIVGLSYQYYTWNYEVVNNFWNDNTVIKQAKDNHYAGGIGLGATLRFANWERLWGSFDLVLTASKREVLPLPQVGIHYFFK